MSSANTSIIESEDIHSHKKSTCLELLTELEKVIFSLTKENLNLTVQKIIKLFDTNFPYTFNTIICNLVYSAFSSQRNSFDIYINLLSMIQTKEEEINQNIIKIISIFIKCISKTKTHEAYNIISRLIEQNLIDANITKNIKSKYFAHYKEEYKKQTNGYEFHRIYPFKKPFGDPIERYFMDHYEELSKNDWELHKKYIKEGHNPNEIAKIIRNDEIEKLQEISSQTKFNINQTIDPSLYEICSFINKPNVTLIDYAAFFGAIQCFKYLLMNGAKLENTAKYAVAGGNLEIIHLCEQNHSSFEDAYETAIEFHRNDIFHYIYENKLEKINHGEPHPMPNNLIFGNGMQFNNNNNNYDNDINILVRFCIQKENYEILTFLEGKKMKIDNNVINESAKSGNLYLVKYFQQNYQLPNNVLVFATYSENIELIKYILEHKGFNINANTLINGEGFTSLLLAIRDNNLEIVKLLLEQSGIDVNAKTRGRRGGEFTSLQLAVQNNNIEIVKLLLAHKDIDVNAKTSGRSGGEYKSIHLAVQNNNIEIVKLLLAHKDIDVNATTFGRVKGEYTALHMAVENNNVEIVRLLIEHQGLDINATTIGENRFTALQIAQQKGYNDIINLLREKGANKNSKEGPSSNELNSLFSRRIEKNITNNRNQTVLQVNKKENIKKKVEMSTQTQTCKNQIHKSSIFQINLY